MLSEFPTKHASNSPVTFVTLKRFAVLLLKLTNDALTASTICWTGAKGKNIVDGAAVDVEDSAGEAKLVEGDGNIASRLLRI